MSQSPLRSAQDSPQQSTDVKRRRFLFALGAGSAGAAAAAVPVAHAVEAVTQPQAEPKGYSETEHVRNYYASTRI
jgi:hypothetical protein